MWAGNRVCDLLALKRGGSIPIRIFFFAYCIRKIVFRFLSSSEGQKSYQTVLQQKTHRHKVIWGKSIFQNVPLFVQYKAGISSYVGKYLIITHEDVYKIYTCMQCTNAHTLALKHTRAHARTHARPPARTHTHTHIHTHTHTHTHRV